jgi:hypothetical protein
MRLLPKAAHAQPAVAPTWCSARAMLGTTGQGLCARLAKPVMRTRRRPERVLLAQWASQRASAVLATMATARRAPPARLEPMQAHRVFFAPDRLIVKLLRVFEILSGRAEFMTMVTGASACLQCDAGSYVQATGALELAHTVHGSGFVFRGT